MERRQPIESNTVPKPLGPYSPALEVAGNGGRWIFVSGQLPVEPTTGELVEGDRQMQTRLILHHIEELLKSAGAAIGHIVRVEIFLTNLEDAPSVNEEYSRWFDGLAKPTRQMVQVSRLPKDAPIEISCIAFAPPTA